jgi:hypothetical protein
MMQDGRTSPVASRDWNDQVGKLHDIFGGAVLTIAAAESFDGNEGFIDPRNPLSYTICRLDLDTKHGYEVVPPCTPRCLQHTFDNALYHLDTRGWVFQERILSRRTAHFTRNFVHLECRTELQCEASSAASCHHSGAVAKADYQVLFSMFSAGELGDVAVEGFLSYWHGLVSKYSNTNLTRESDYLLAMAGLAQRIQKQARLTWSFGLWREHILRGMLWYVRGGKGLPARERGPTWSWASVKVRGPRIQYDFFSEPSLVARITALPEESSFTPQTALSPDESRYRVKVVGQLKYGAPDSTEFQAKKSSSTASASQKRTIAHRFCQGMPHLHPECPFHPDYNLPRNLELYSLLLARVCAAPLKADLTQGPPLRLVEGPQGRHIHVGYVTQGWDTEVGLVLTPVGGRKGRYRRVGYFHHTMYLNMDSGIERAPSFFEDITTEEIEIV